MLRLAAALPAAAALSACGSSDEADSGAGAVSVGIIPIVDVAPVYLGLEKGFFTSRDIDLTLESVAGGAAIVTGVAGAEYQFGFSNVTSLMLAQANGVPVKAVANGVNSTGVQGGDFSAIVVNGDSDIESAADLPGRKVSINTLKGIGDTTVRESVRKAGGDPDDPEVQFAEMPFAQMGAALENGDVDAAWLVEPGLSAAKAAGAREIASNFVDAAPNLTVALYFTSAQVEQEDPGLVARFREGIEESLQYADAHGDEVRAVLATYTDLDEEARNSLILPKWPTEINRASIEALMALGQTDGLFTAAPDLDALLP